MPSERAPRVALVLIAAVAILAMTATGSETLQDEVPATVQGQEGWRVVLSPAADLWYHGLAVIGAETLGPLPAYSDEYVELIKQEKERLGLYPTQLDSLAAELAAEISADDQLLILHSVPLYFHGVGPERMLEALEALARGRLTDPAASGRDVRYGITVLSQVVVSGDQRRLLGSLVEVLREEWQTFFEMLWTRYRTEQEDYILEMQRLWDILTLDLSDFLERNRIDVGTLIPSPPLGGEGRVLAGDPGDRFGTLVAVHLPFTGLEVHTALYAAVKELCFLLVDYVVDPTIRDAAVLETQQSRAAVRCGAMLLEFHAPALAVGYRRFYLESVGMDVSQGTTVAAFEEAYPLDQESVIRLREEVRRR